MTNNCLLKAEVSIKFIPPDLARSSEHSSIKEHRIDQAFRVLPQLQAGFLPGRDFLYSSLDLSFLLIVKYPFKLVRIFALFAEQINDFALEPTIQVHLISTVIGNLYGFWVHTRT